MPPATLKAWAWQRIATSRDRFPYLQIAGACRSYLRAHEGQANFQIELDGELRVLDALHTDGAACVFDVGANVGEWTIAAAAAIPSATIHSFEPVPSTSERLVEATAHLGDRVHANQVGLSDGPGTLEINVPKSGSPKASLFGSAGSRHAIEVTTGDDYCAAHDIDHIRFLKVDTEGWDHKVLAGFSRMLADRRIDAVQFEYGSWALESRFLLLDFYDLLEGHGMVVGKIYPSSVAFGPYRPELEDFRGLNFLAVSRVEHQVIERLR